MLLFIHECGPPSKGCELNEPSTNTSICELLFCVNAQLASPTSTKHIPTFNCSWTLLVSQHALYVPV